MGKTICICGGGQTGTVLAAVCGAMGCSVRVLTGRPASWGETVSAVLPDSSVLSSPLHVTDDPSAAVRDADIVLLCVPGNIIESTLASLAPHLGRGTAVGSVVCSTGFFRTALRVLPEGTPLFGFQRVPFICVMQKYGHSARLTGRRKLVKMAFLSMDPASRNELMSFFGQVSGAPVAEIGYLEASLTNSNPLLHPSRCYSLFHAWDGTPFARKPLFYEEWDDFASEIYIGCDSELQTLLSLLPVDRKEIPPVLEYYESSDCSSLSAKIRSIEAFKGIPAPMREVPGGYVPDFGHRFYIEDLPFGMRLVRELAAEHSLATPVIDRVLAWGDSIVENDKSNNR